MPQNVVFNGTTYAIPLAGELNWSSLSNFLIDVGTNAAVDTDQKQSIRVAVTSPVVVAATSDYAVFSNLTVPGAVAVTLPAGINGQIFVLGDGKGDALTNNITITPNGAQTINGASTLVLNKAYQVAILQYHLGSTDWKIQLLSIPPGTLINADISSAAAIARAKIAAGTASQVVVNDGAGLLSSVAVLGTSVGGTAQNSTAVFPTSGNVTTDSNTQTLTNKSYDAAGTGNVLANVVDSNIASGAAIARAKIASGSANQVIINDGAGVLSSEAQLARTRGGTGISSTATFPSSGVIVTEAATETLTNKTLTGAVVSDFEVLTEIATPANPSAGSMKIYAKVDNKVYSLTSGGVETALGAGSGVTTMSAFGSTPSANAGIITGSNLELEPADATHPGAISTAYQVIPGVKEATLGLFNTTATGADADTILTSADKRVQQVTPTAVRTYTLPTTGIKAGEIWRVENIATPVPTSNIGVFVSASDASSIVKLYSGATGSFKALINTPVTNTDWAFLSQDYPLYTNFTPVVMFGANTSTITVIYSRFRRWGMTVHWQANITVTARNIPGASTMTVSLPYPANSAGFMGTGQYLDSSANKNFTLIINTAFDLTNPAIRTNRAAAATVGSLENMTASNTNDGDQFAVDITYETGF